MSKYHPLDVRHPSNRAAEKRAYLLDPLPQPPRAPGRATRGDPASAARTDTRASAEPRSPWGRSGTGRAEPPAAAPAAPPRTTRQRGSGGSLLAFMVLLAAWYTGLIPAFFDFLAELADGASWQAPR